MEWSDLGLPWPLWLLAVWRLGWVGRDRAGNGRESIWEGGCSSCPGG